MATVWPVDFEDYVFLGGAVKVFRRVFRLMDSVTMSGTRGGQSWDTARGTRLWYGELSIVPQRTQDQMPIEARLRALSQPGAEFFLGDIMAPKVVGVGSPTLRTVAANNVDVSLQGMTPNSRIPVGAYVSFNYPGGRAFHQLLTEAVANASGVSNVFEVQPSIKPGYALSTAVSVAAPKLRAKMVPGSFKDAEAGDLNSDGMSLSWIQVIS